MKILARRMHAPQAGISHRSHSTETVKNQATEKFEVDNRDYTKK